MLAINQSTKNSLRYLTLAAVLATSIPISFAADEWEISASGYGPVLVGMKIKQVEKVLGTQLQTWENRRFNPDCDHLYPKTGKEVAFMFRNGELTRIEVGIQGVVSDTGVGVGDPASKLKELYGNKLEIVRYDEGTYYYYVWNTKGQAIRYEVDSDSGVMQVRRIYSGSGGSIRLVEGCS